LREGLRSSEENEFRARKAAFFDGLNDRRLTSGFGQGAGCDFFIEQGEIPSGEAAFFKQGFEFGAEERRRASDYDALGVPRYGH
jgi:hypothetical protein